jgi:hypothetical protein
MTTPDAVISTNIKKLLRPGALRDKNNLQGTIWRALLVEEVAN